MSLYLPGTGVASSAAFKNTMVGLDLTTLRVFGNGVISGLTVSGAGQVQTGEALIGHVVALAAPVTPAYVASTTNYVYLVMPSAPAYPGADGKDAGQIVVNQTGTPPASSVLLASVVTGAGASITSVNTSPAGRRNLTLPVTLADVRHVGDYSAGTTYAIGNVVAYAGGSYMARTINTGVTPADGANWGVVSTPGTAGATGPAGPAGAAGTSTPAAASALGLVEMSTAPASAGTPIAVGDNDPRMTNARTPLAHAASHAAGGSDALTPASIGALATTNNLSDITNQTTAQHNLGLGTAATAALPAPGSNASASQVVRGDDTRLAAPVAQKRRFTATFYPASSTVDAAPNTGQTVRLPGGTGGAATSWKLTSATLRAETPNSAATTVQLFYDSTPGNAVFAGTAALSASLSVSGSSAYEASTTAFTGTLASAGLPTGSVLAPEWTALGAYITTNVGPAISLVTEWDEA